MSMLLLPLHLKLAEPLFKQEPAENLKIVFFQEVAGGQLCFRLKTRSSGPPLDLIV
jgi:hypothetical protein